MTWGLNSGRGKRFFCIHQNVQTDIGSHPASYALGTWTISHGENGQFVKLATSVKVKNEWNYISAFHVCIYGMDRNVFTLFIYLFILLVYFYHLIL
jgi:hypothetical protein